MASDTLLIILLLPRLLEGGKARGRVFCGNFGFFLFFSWLLLLATSVHICWQRWRSQPGTDGMKTKNIFPLWNVTFHSKKTVFRPTKDAIFFFFWLCFVLGFFFLLFFKKKNTLIFFPGCWRAVCISLRTREGCKIKMFPTHGKTWGRFTLKSHLCTYEISFHKRKK